MKINKWINNNKKNRFSDASSVIPDDTPVDVDMADNGSASLQLDDSSTLPTTTDMNLWDHGLAIIQLDDSFNISRRANEARDEIRKE